MKVFFICCVFLLSTAVLVPCAGADSQQNSQGISERLDRLTAQVESLVKKQEDILASQSQAIEEIKNLKILVHRRN